MLLKTPLIFQAVFFLHQNYYKIIIDSEIKIYIIAKAYNL